MLLKYSEDLPENRLEITVSREDEGRKLSSLLKSVPGMSQTKLSSMKYDPEGILLNGHRSPVSAVLRAGDVISILLWDSENRVPHLLPNPLPLRVLWEDRNIIVLNKPAGQVCHPSKGHLTDSLANALFARLRDREPRAAIHFLGRLDKDTSGLVTVAKNGFTAERLNLLKTEGKVQKTYLALASGHFPEERGVIDIPMEEYRTEDNILRNRRGTSETGQPALTRYHVLSEYEDFSLLEVTIGTGRMHQIRFHMAETGHPLLGDPLYGTGPDGRIGRTALHAWKLRLQHPYTGEEIEVTATPEEDISRLLLGRLP